MQREIDESYSKNNFLSIKSQDYFEDYSMIMLYFLILFFKN